MPAASLRLQSSKSTRKGFRQGCRRRSLTNYNDGFDKVKFVWQLQFQMRPLTGSKGPFFPAAPSEMVLQWDQTTSLKPKTGLAGTSTLLAQLRLVIRCSQRAFKIALPHQWKKMIQHDMICFSTIYNSKTMWNIVKRKAYNFILDYMTMHFWIFDFGLLTSIWWKDSAWIHSIFKYPS